jgi:hypothetical protein
MNTLIVMDLQTKRITTVASKEDPSLAQGDLVPQVAHGSVFWQDLTFDSQYGNPQSGLIKMRDLATGVTKTLSTPGLAVNSDNNARGIGIGGTYGYLFTVDWPYVAFTVGNSPDTAREAVLDVTSGNVTPLSLPPAVHAAPSPHDIVYGMNGTTVIAGWFAVDGSMNFSQYHLSGSLQSWQPITTITDPSYIFVQDGGFEISDRFILFSAKTGNKTATLAWDRSLHLFFTAASFVNSSTGDVQLADIFGNWLVIATYHNNSQSTDYSLIDTTNLQLQTHG